MASVDDRVVQMTFDNANFENKISSTLKSLDSLQKSLKMADGAKGMQDVSAAAKNFNMEGVKAGIEGVSKSFIALSTIGITVLSNLANRAVDAGISMVKSLSLDQVTAGFQEYETNMKSIQTILANTKQDGTGLSDVNAALDELNSYADLTIYNFAEMARNIGTFTAAGVDLETSTASIKGIANAAAISGSTSQQASTAMYQLSQAIASGSLKLMDWNSVVNAGMGGEVMQRALFQTGKAMGTLTGVDLETTFDDWKDAGNTFRESLQEGWVTTDVLTTALKGFSGEATAAELAAKGFTDEMIAEFEELGETGIEAATKVRTFTQLMDTAREAVGSGWSQTFRILLGDFNEATALFTGIADAFGGYAERSAETRNELLQGWKDLGGRANLIDALKTAFYALGKALDPIREAFRSIFPKTTAKDLQKLTQSFAAFTQKLIPSAATVDRIRIVAKGFFATLSIGWTILKETASFIFFLGKTIAEAFGGTAGGLLEKFAQYMYRLQLVLVRFGGIEDFFDGLKAAIVAFADEPKVAIEELKDTILNFFDGLTGGKSTDIFGGVGEGVDRLKDRFDGLQRVFDRLRSIWEPFKNAISGVLDILGRVWEAISDWFSELASRMGDALGEGDFDAVVDILNVALLGGIAGILAKFMKSGINFDIGDGLFENISDSFDQLTGVLSGMQAKLKAEALLKLAIAIGILTASVLVLSTIDSGALTKALTAMAVGFGQLVGTMTVLTKLSGPSGALSFTAMATGLILIASAMLILSVAVKILATLSWNEIAKGLVAVTGLLAALSAAVKLMSSNSGGMIRAGIGILFIAGAMNLLAIAMKIFATMSWEEMAKGLVGVAGGLAAIVAAMNLLPKGMALKAAGIFIVAAGLNLLATAMKVMGSLSWGEIAKGLVGITGGLLAIAGAMHLMPLTLPITAAGLVLVAVALNIISGAMKIIASMSWGELAKGLAGMAGALLILGIATTAMSGAILGAVAIGIVATSLLVLAKAMKEFGSLSIGEMIGGLIAMAGAFIVLGVAALAASALIGPLLALGAALVVIGAGFALFGVGAYLTARAFEVLAKVGAKAGEAIITILKAVAKAIPGLVQAFAEGLIDLAKELLAAAPVLIEMLKVLLIQILDTLIEISPKLAEAVTVMLLDLIQVVREVLPEFLEAFRELIPDLVETGFALIMGLLEGIRENIGAMVDVAAEIIVEFIRGITENLGDILTAGTDLIVELIKGIADSYTDILDAGADAIIAFVEGVASNVLKVVEAGFQIVIDFLNGLADSIERNRGPLAEAGLNLLDAIFGGVLSFFSDTVGPWLSGFPSLVVSTIGNVFTTLRQTGEDLLEGLFNGVRIAFVAVRTWFRELKDRILALFDGAIEWLKDVGVWIIEGLIAGMKSMGQRAEDAAWSIVNRVLDPFNLLPDIGSPSRVTHKIGAWIMEGLMNGMSDMERPAVRESSRVMGNVMSALTVDDKELTNPLQDAMRSVVDSMANMDEFDGPVITPVLDLTNIKSGAKQLNRLIDTESAYSQAVAISATQFGEDGPDQASTQASEVKYEQNIFAPTRLSTSDIYRETKGLIAVSKKELEIQ